MHFGDTPSSLGQARHFFKQMGSTRQKAHNKAAETYEYGSTRQQSTYLYECRAHTYECCLLVHIPTSTLQPNAARCLRVRQHKAADTYECCLLSSTLQPNAARYLPHTILLTHPIATTYYQILQANAARYLPHTRYHLLFHSNEYCKCSESNPKLYSK